MATFANAVNIIAGQTSPQLMEERILAPLLGENAADNAFAPALQRLWMESAVFTTQDIKRRVFACFLLSLVLMNVS